MKGLLLLGMLLWPTVASAQTDVVWWNGRHAQPPFYLTYTMPAGLFVLFEQANPCDSDAQPPFYVTSARSFRVQFCTRVNTTDPATGATVPERIDGFYASIDMPTKTEVKPIPLGTSTVTNRNAWELTIASGVTKGSHKIYVVAWNYVLDPNTGQPTTERAESAAIEVPFTAVDPVFNLPPSPVTGGRIIR